MGYGSLAIWSTADPSGKHKKKPHPMGEAFLFDAWQ